MLFKARPFLNYMIAADTSEAGAWLIAGVSGEINATQHMPYSSCMPHMLMMWYLKAKKDA